MEIIVQAPFEECNYFFHLTYMIEGLKIVLGVISSSREIRPELFEKNKKELIELNTERQCLALELRNRYVPKEILKSYMQFRLDVEIDTNEFVFTMFGEKK